MSHSFIDAIVSGRVYGAPEVRHDKNDSPFALVKFWISPATPDARTLFASAIAFIDGPYHEILALKAGDPVFIIGSVKISLWEDDKQQHHPAIEMVAVRVMALKFQNHFL